VFFFCISSIEFEAIYLTNIAHERDRPNAIYCSLLSEK